MGINLVKKIKTESKKGFTLMEVIVAIFLLTVGIIASYALITFVISSTTYASNKFTAAYLAQEGIELVRNIRDTNWVQSGSLFSDGLTSCDGDCAGTDGSGCVVDYLSSQSADIKLDSAYQFHDSMFLSIDANGFYASSGPTPTKFQRQVNIKNQGTYLEVCVWVGWKEKEINHSVVVRENLYDWR